MTSDWLTERIAVIENVRSAEDILARLDLTERSQQQIRDHLASGDELWHFRSPPWTWSNMGGRAGVSLVRDGEVIQSVVTRMN